MPMTPLKENASVEEMRQWIIDITQTFNTMETQLEEKTKREKELETLNQKMFLKITTKQEDKHEDTEETPDFLDADTFKLLDKKDKQLLNEIMEEE